MPTVGVLSNLPKSSTSNAAKLYSLLGIIASLIGVSKTAGGLPLLFIFGATGFQVVLAQMVDRDALFNAQTLENATDAFASGDSLVNFQNAIEQYLTSWDSLKFQSSVDTYVVPNSVEGFGVYNQHTSNIFSPGEFLELYIQPVSYAHEQTTYAQGNTLYFLSITAETMVCRELYIYPFPISHLFH